MHLGKLGAVVAAGTAALAIAGCDDFTGGGQLPSQADPAAKATFGFVFHANQNKMQGTYHDKAAGVKFKFDGGSGYALDGQFIASGTYISQDPKRPGSGQFTIYGSDAGEPGPSNGDFLQISLGGGPFDGYSDEGIITGGNLQAH